MAVVIPKRIRREIELINKGVPRTVKKKPKQTHSELVKKALGVVALLNEIASTPPVRGFIEKHTDILIVPRVWKVVLTRRLSRLPQCAARLDVEGSVSEYSCLSAEIDFHFWSEADLLIFTSLNEKKIKKIILDWLRAYRERLPESYR